MNIGLNTHMSDALFSNVEQKKENLGIKNLYTKKVEGDELKALKDQVKQNSQAFSLNIEIIQVDISFKSGESENVNSDFEKNYQEFQDFLDNIGYKGKAIADLSQDEAKELVSDDGFFGIDQTSQRIADFVIQGAGDDADLLKAGLDGILQGFNEAEEIWGSKLPDISYKTIDKAKDLITKHMNEVGVNILDTSA